MKDLYSPDLHRRSFLRVGGLNILGITLSQWLAAKESAPVGKGKAQACILLLLEGGASQVDTFDPKPESVFKPISTNVAGIQVTELLPKIAKQMDKISLVRSMHTEETNHMQATHYALTGHKPNPAMQFPCFGSIVSKELGGRNNVPPHFVQPELIRDPKFFEFFKGSFAGAEYDAMVLPDANAKDFQVPDLTLPKSISAERIADRRAFLSVVDAAYRRKADSAEHVSVDRFTEQALKMVLTPQVRNAFDIAQEPDKVRNAYGRHRFGQSALLARRLVESGARFVTAAGYGTQAWDTHNNNDATLRDNLAPPFDQAFSALLEDLSQRGMLESTVVIALGEFGRTTKNANNGRDHWPQCWSLAIGGGGIRGGQVVGESDAKGQYVKDRLVTMGDLYATVYKAMGIDVEKTYMSPIGRPVKIANSIDDKTGVPIKELI